MFAFPRRPFDRPDRAAGLTLHLSAKLVAGSASCSTLKTNILRCSSCMRDALVVLFNTIAAAMPPLQRFAQRSPIPLGNHLRDDLRM